MMERRFVLAVTLMIAVLVVPSFFMKRPVPRRPAAADTTAAATVPQGPGLDTTRHVPAATPAVSVPAASGAAIYDTALVTQPSAVYRVSTAGATIDRATFPGFKSFHDKEHKTAVQLVRPGDRLLVHRLVTGIDT